MCWHVAKLTGLIGLCAAGSVTQVWAADDAGTDRAALTAYETSGVGSKTFRVAIGETVVPVLQFGDIDYVHFACSETVNVNVARLDGHKVMTCRVRPDRWNIPAICDGDTVRVSVEPGQKLVVNVDRLRKLFVFAERREDHVVAEQAGTVDVVRSGADPTGVSDSTQAIQAAIDSLPTDGVLYFPPGFYRSGSLQLKSNMTLYLSGGALLKGSDDHRRFRHHRDSSYLYFLLADGLEDVRIAGRGIIDGNGRVVRRKWEAQEELRKQPGRLLLCRDSRNIEVRDVILRDSYSWTAHFVDCCDCALQNVKILADTRLSNGDGLDVDGCRRMTAEGLFIYGEDDAISVKAAWSREDPEDLTFRNCVLWSQNATGIRLGTETRSEAFRDLRFEDLSILRANTMIRIFCNDGADIHDIVFRNIDTEELTKHVPSDYDEYRRIRELSGGVTYLLQLQVRNEGDGDPGMIRDVLFENINARVAAGSKIKGYNLPEGMVVIRNVTLRNLRIEGRSVLDASGGRFDVNEHAELIRFESDKSGGRTTAIGSER